MLSDIQPHSPRQKQTEHFYVVPPSLRAKDTGQYMMEIKQKNRVD